METPCTGLSGAFSAVKEGGRNKMTEFFMHNVYGMESNISITGLFFSLTLAFILGGALANIYYHLEPEVTKGFSITLALFSPMICVIMLLLSRNSGSGIAAIGAFALLRYKSAPGTAKELLALLISIGIGIACSTGFLLATIILAIPVFLLFFLLSRSEIWNTKEKNSLSRRITVEPSQRMETREMLEGLIGNYVEKYTLVETKYDYNKTTEKKAVRYTYEITLKGKETEGTLIDALIENRILFTLGASEGKRQVRL